MGTLARDRTLVLHIYQLWTVWGSGGHCVPCASVSQWQHTWGMLQCLQDSLYMSKGLTQRRDSCPHQQCLLPLPEGEDFFRLPPSGHESSSHLCPLSISWGHWHSCKSHKHSEQLADGLSICTDVLSMLRPRRRCPVTYPTSGSHISALSGSLS
jgi:hypothetical protein